MLYMQEMWIFIWSVVNSWAGYATGGVLVASFWLLQLLRKDDLPRAISRKIGIGLAIVFLFFAFFNAWREQYKENEISREVGILTLDHVEGGKTTDPSIRQQGQMVAIVLRNSTSKLIEYHVDTFDLNLDSHMPSGSYVNRGSYVYPSQYAIFRSLLVPDWKGNETTFKGTLHYSITYGIVGSSQKHHSSKTIEFPCNGSSFSGMNYTIMEEHED